MTDKVTTRSRPSTHQILSRIIAAPDVALQVRGLPPAVVGGLIRRIGLEDAGELVAFATTQQLAAIFDEDLWRSDRAGQDETFDADRFVLWLEVLLEAGEQVVARRLAELPVDLVTLALHRQLLVVDMDALIPDMQEGGDEVDQIEKALSDCPFEELDAYRLIARHPDGWDVLWTAILALDRDHHDHLMRILDRCAALSAGRVWRATFSLVCATMSGHMSADRPCSALVRMRPTSLRGSFDACTRSLSTSRCSAGAAVRTAAGAVIT